MLSSHKTVLLLSLTLIITLTSNAQWFNQISGTADNLYAVRFASKDTGIAVGGSLYQSTFLKTTDGGNTWHSQIFSSSKWMYALEYLGNGIFVAGGYNGVIYKSTDYGSTWTPRPSQTTEWIYDLHFPHPDTGYAVGLNGIILRSVNAGDNWSPLPYQAPITLLDVHFHTPSLGIAVGIDGRIFKTTNAGLDWQEMNNVDNRTLTSVWMINTDTIVACGLDGIIIRSTNGGQAWTSVISGTPNHLQDLIMAENNIFYAVGYGSIIRSSNAGISWTAMNYPVTTNLTAIDVVGTSTAFAVGLSGTIIKNDLTLSEQSFEKYQINIYPNPANVELLIDFPDDVQLHELRVCDIWGKIILNQKISAIKNYRISVETLSPGIYFIHLSGSDFFAIYPVIINH